MFLSLDEQFWSSKYLQNDTGWDVGSISQPLKQYLDQIKNKGIRILIPGAGNAYEAGYAYKNGFVNIHILDISDLPLKNFQAAIPDFPKSNIHHQDFFVHENKYDLILEQTFFCALPLGMRKQYASKTHDLLNEGGKIAGVLFNRNFPHDGPPFGGSMEEYQLIFNKYFKIQIMEDCYNSISPRKGTELFVLMQKKLNNVECNSF